MDSVAARAAAEAEIALSRIKLPTLDTYEPEQIVAAAAAFAAAVRKVVDAEAAVAKIKADQIERDKRIAVLQAALAAIPTDPMDVWCCIYREKLSGTVKTVEVPGFWLDEPVLKTALLDEGELTERTVAYYERSWNIVPTVPGVSDVGKVTPAEGMSDAAIAYNLAMEPGHLKWHPAWRYGIWQGGGVVELNPHFSREEQDDEAVMSIDQKETLTGVPIYYPPCNGRVFEPGDEVLVIFQGQQQQNPLIIGFRREPEECPASWYQYGVDSNGLLHDPW